MPASTITEPSLGVCRIAFSKRFRSARSTSGADTSSSVGGPTRRPSRFTRLAAATGAEPARTSETRSPSDTRSNCNRRTPAWVRLSSKRSSTRAAKWSTCSRIVRKYRCDRRRVVDHTVLERLDDRPHPREGRAEVVRHPCDEVAPRSLERSTDACEPRRGAPGPRPAPTRDRASSDGTKRVDRIGGFPCRHRRYGGRPRQAPDSR